MCFALCVCESLGGGSQVTSHLSHDQTSSRRFCLFVLLNESLTHSILCLPFHAIHLLPSSLSLLLLAPRTVRLSSTCNSACISFLLLSLFPVLFSLVRERDMFTGHGRYSGAEHEIHYAAGPSDAHRYLSLCTPLPVSVQSRDKSLLFPLIHISFLTTYLCEIDMGSVDRKSCSTRGKDVDEERSLRGKKGCVSRSCNCGPICRSVAEAKHKC